MSDFEYSLRLWLSQSKIARLRKADIIGKLTNKFVKISLRSMRTAQSVISLVCYSIVDLK